uniref:Uncharacterized protein n=1 Tax=Coccidioides posadasii RMSCC 3488 TaxID=454284 RepID=A0A0J6HY07_COCPO|nr:hypothetical protein CPAG_00201 [Coccidioides posadasii RMSCC 3488]
MQNCPIDGGSSVANVFLRLGEQTIPRQRQGYGFLRILSLENHNSEHKISTEKRSEQSWNGLEAGPSRGGSKHPSNMFGLWDDFVPLASITINIIFWLDQTAKDEGPEPPCEECDSVPAAALAFLWNHGEVWKWSALGDDQERALSLKHRSIGPP